LTTRSGFWGFQMALVQEKVAVNCSIGLRFEFFAGLPDILKFSYFLYANQGIVRGPWSLGIIIFHTNSKWFWRWLIILIIRVFRDFVHRLVLQTWQFGTLDLFPSSAESCGGTWWTASDRTVLLSVTGQPKSLQLNVYRRPPLFDGPLFDGPLFDGPLFDDPLFDDPLFRPFSIITWTYTFDAWSAISTYFVIFPRPSTSFCEYALLFSLSRLGSIFSFSLCIEVVCVYICIYIVCYLAFARICKWYIVRYLRFSAAKINLKAKKTGFRISTISGFRQCSGP
jgi:hypothetical protein